MTQQATKEPKVSTWQGSLKTAVLIRRQIAERWGEEEAEKYSPLENCFTFNTWKSKGYSVKKGEQALRSYTLVAGSKSTDESEDEGENGKYLKGVCLFYYLQVEKKTVN